MAISFDMSNYRADYMISDAAISQRIGAQISKEQTNGFADLLQNCGKTEIRVEKVDAAVPLSIDKLEPVMQSNGYYDISGMDLKEVARMILRGEIDIDDIDPEQITPELLKALIIVAKTEELTEEDDEDNGDEEEDFFVPNGEDGSKTLDATTLDEILAILYKFIDAYTDTRYDDETKDAIGGIEELLANFPDLPGISEAYGKLEKSGDDGKDAFLAHIMEMRAQLASEAEEQPANVDQFVKSDALPADTKAVSAEQSFAKEMVNAIGAENVKLLEEAAQNGELGEVSVKRTEQEIPEQEQAPIEAAAQQPVKTDEAADRAKAISEELEMLRNARLNKTEVQPVEEKTSEEKESTPIQAANPLEVDSPIVFAGRDGSEVTVNPADVVAQAAKLVETAITENNEQNEYSLVLNPEELGKITVKLVKAADGAISVTIAAESARTQRILAQNSHLMQSNLRDDGIRLENWQVVRESQQETLAQDYNGSSKNPYYRDDTAKDDEEDRDGRSFADIIAAM